MKCFTKTKFLLFSLLITGGILLFAQSTLPPAKQAIEQQYKQERAAGEQNPAARDPNAPFPNIATPPFETGIFTDCDSLRSAIVENCWRGILANVETTVYAGSESQSVDPQQGVVVVWTTSGNYVPTPIQAGPVRIISAQNDTLTLVTTNNAYVLTFDIDAQSFTSIKPVSSVPTAGNGCDGVYSGTFIGDITVSSVQSCTFVAGGINGNVTEIGGSLVLLSATARNVKVTGGSYLIGPSTQITGDVEISNVLDRLTQGQICGAAIKNNLSVHDNAVTIQIGASHSCAGNTIGGNLEAHNNSGATGIFFNTVAGNLNDFNNTGRTQVYVNNVSGNLQCENNSVIMGANNTAQSKQGQCADF
jgi:hypothetical protein